MRKHPRLQNFDYSAAGAYFITICTKNRKKILSDINVGRGLAPAENILTECGAIVEENIRQIECRYPFVTVAYSVVMPNHVHLLLVLHESAAGASPRPTRDEMKVVAKSNYPSEHAVRAAGASPRPTKEEMKVVAKSNYPCEHAMRAAGASPRPTISDIVCAFKSLSSRQCKQRCGYENIFQTSFYDHVIRNENDFATVAEYITYNPDRWQTDCFYTAD